RATARVAARDRRRNRTGQAGAVGFRDDLPRRGNRTELRIEVVERRRRHECLRQLGDPPDEVRPPLGIQLGEDVVEQEQWGAISAWARASGSATSPSNAIRSATIAPPLSSSTPSQ